MNPPGRYLATLIHSFLVGVPIAKTTDTITEQMIIRFTAGDLFYDPPRQPRQR
jgi:hypothetical protein